MAAPESIDDIRRCECPVVAFSDEMELAQKEIKEFLFARMYRHAAILPVWKNAGRIVRGLFSIFFAEPDRHGGGMGGGRAPRDETGRARVVADYIAGMTDRYALARAREWLGGGRGCA